jgi:ribosomal protein L14E/L6E/L27E
MVRNDNGDKVPGYFVFKINHKPIPEVEETELNMSQLVAANKVLEEKMAERDEEIKALNEELAKYKPTTEPIGNCSVCFSTIYPKAWHKK